MLSSFDVVVVCEKARAETVLKKVCRSVGRSVAFYLSCRSGRPVGRSVNRFMSIVSVRSCRSVRPSSCRVGRPFFGFVVSVWSGHMHCPVPFLLNACGTGIFDFSSPQGDLSS